MKAKKPFIYALTGVLVLVFFGLAMKFFGVWDISDFLTAVIMIVLGFGLVTEGGPRYLVKMMENGLTGDEITHILAIFVGFVSMIVGILLLPAIGIHAYGLDVMAGIVACVSAILTPVELLLVD